MTLKTIGMTIVIVDESLSSVVRIFNVAVPHAGLALVLVSVLGQDYLPSLASEIRL